MVCIFMYLFTNIRSPSALQGSLLVCYKMFDISAGDDLIGLIHHLLRHIKTTWMQFDWIGLKKQLQVNLCIFDIWEFSYFFLIHNIGQCGEMTVNTVNKVVQVAARSEEIFKVVLPDRKCRINRRKYIYLYIYFFNLWLGWIDTSAITVIISIRNVKVDCSRFSSVSTVSLTREGVTPVPIVWAYFLKETA